MRATITYMDGPCIPQNVLQEDDVKYGGHYIEDLIITAKNQLVAKISTLSVEDFKELKQINIVIELE